MALYVAYFVCIYELGVNEIFIIGHHECGMAKLQQKI